MPPTLPTACCLSFPTFANHVDAGTACWRLAPRRSAEQDPYGNYVVQYVLGICCKEEADILVNMAIGKVKTIAESKQARGRVELYPFCS